MKKHISALFAVILAVNALAADIPASVLALHSSDENTEYDITESKVMPKLNKTITREGKMLFQAPDDLRIDFTEPAGDYTLITKDIFEVKKNGKVQHFNIKNPTHKMSIYRATLLCCLAGKVEEAARLNDATAEYKEAGGKYVCTIKADKAIGREIEELLLEYDRKTGKLLLMKITEGNGNYTEYKVSK